MPRKKKRFFFLCVWLLVLSDSICIHIMLDKSRDILDRCKTHSVERKKNFVEIFRFIFKGIPKNSYWYITKRK